MARQRKRTKRRHGFAYFVLLLLALIIWSFWGNTALTRTDITFASARVPMELDGLVIAHISDLHDANLGNDNSDIVEMVAKARPDIIVLTGDMIDSNRLTIERTLSLAERLVAIAPVYYANGNHEAALSNNDYHRLTRGLRDAGVEVLEDRSVVVSWHNASFQIVGLNDPGFTPGTNAEKFDALENSLLLLTRNDMFTLVLAHRPEFIGRYSACNPELVLSGHAHGGQIRLPLIGGLYAPGQGAFPKYDAGLYTKGKTSMIVSRGIGNSSAPLRINNRPEIVIITLKSEGHP